MLSVNRFVLVIAISFSGHCDIEANQKHSSLRALSPPRLIEHPIIIAWFVPLSRLCSFSTLYIMHEMTFVSPLW
jgi:hypothetical protein